MAFWDPLFHAYLVVTNVHSIIFMILIPCYEASTEIPREGNCTNSGKVDITTFIFVTAALGLIYKAISYFTSHTERQRLEESVKREFTAMVEQSLGKIIKTALEESLNSEIAAVVEQSLCKRINTVDKAPSSENTTTLEKLKNELANRKAQYKLAWRNSTLYPDWRKEEFETVNVMLDEMTAHPNLLLSRNQTQVTWQEKPQDLPRSAQRFDSIPAVLGQLRVRRGRFYWEVQVGDTGSWDLGVCSDGATRKGRVIVYSQNSFWAIRLFDGDYWALSNPEIRLTMKQKPYSVGIFLDIEDGDVSFYNMKDKSHIFSFKKISFSGVLRPFVRLWSGNSEPLTMVQVKGTD